MLTLLLTYAHVQFMVYVTYLSFCPAPEATLDIYISRYLDI